jgi:hypothetical protein
MATATTDEQVRELYARFGAAYYYSEVLRSGLCSFYALSSMPIVGGTRGRFDELFAQADAEPLGGLISLIAERLPATLAEVLRSAVGVRNFLAHRFWYERIQMMTSEDGVRTLTEELMRYADMFQLVDGDMHDATCSLYQRLGIEESAIDRAVANAIAGVPLEEIKPERRLRSKGKETIVAVYDVPTPSGASSTLIFETSDNRLWQLCDVGLGWSPYESIGTSWRRCDIFDPFLPASVDPRPKLRTPWNYGIDFSGKAILLVRLSDDGLFRWTVKRPKAKSMRA